MKLFYILIPLLFLLVWPVKQAYAIFDPLTVPNNRFGIHIFDADELDQAADMVNGNGGEWGYVTVPIRADDRNRQKWNAFMKKAKEKKIIPIVRLATTMTPDSWSKPQWYDAIDFANFLADLDWPVKNRYVIVYNEPNHATEWGGNVNPEEYAQILEDTIKIFKERHDDFFMLPAGLDAAAPNDKTHLNWKLYLQRMYASHPDALKLIDGWNSHSYPNPAFSGSPYANHDHSVSSYKYETNTVEKLTGRNYPIFITETGWSNEFVSDNTIATYFQQTLDSNWSDSRIVAITPFVLRAYDGPFEKFSFLKRDGSPKPQYEVWKNYTKTKGEPLSPKPKYQITDMILGSEVASPSSDQKTEDTEYSRIKGYWESLKDFFH